MHENIRTFKAATVEDALAQIRREMGFDAVVVETKQVERRSLLPWGAARNEVEVKAARVPAQRRAQAGRKAAAPQTLAASMMQTASATVEPPHLRTSLAEDLAPKPSSPDQLVPDERVSPRFRFAMNELSPVEMPDVGQRFDSSARPEPRPPVLLSELTNSSAPISDPVAVEKQAAPSDIEQRLDSLQQMIAELGRRNRPRGLIEIPPELFAHYLTLIEADVDDEIARELIAKLHQHAAPGQLADTAAATSLLTALIEREVRCAEPISPRRGCRQVAMLVGPTGVGKTTTIAKLAGRFSVSHGLRVGLITVDTYRVAAVDQLRTYAEIIDLPMHVVTSPEELQAALAALADFDLVLIDTAGRSPHDERRLEELKQLVDAAAPDHICLVLSLASGAKSLRGAAERFAAARPTSLILTKLDEADGCGAVLSAARDIVLPVTYLTAGQEVPRDIEPANPCRIARLILGRDRLNLDRDDLNTSASVLSPRPGLARRG